MPVRSPRAWLQLGTGRVNLLHAEVVLARYGMPSTFMVDMAVDDATNPGGMFWSQETPIPASVIGNNGDGTSGDKVMLVGNIDVVEVDWDTRKVTVHGSDMIGTMLDTRTDQHFPNMTPSQVVEQIAGKYGFNLHVDQSASDKAGTSYDGQDWSFNTDYENEWDAIQSLAQHEGKAAYLVGNDFYFTDPGNSSGDVYPIHYTPPEPGAPPSLNAMSLKTWRNLQMENFSAKVATFHPFEKKPFVGETQSGGAGGGGGGESGASGFDESGFE